MNDLQNTTNGFQTLSYYHTISSEKDRESNLFIGAYAREGGLVYAPGQGDPATFQFAGDTTKSYVLAEDRSFTTLGTRIKFDSRLSHQFMYTVGMNFSSSTGKENFTANDSLGNPDFSATTNFAGSDFGVFAEGELHPFEWTRIEAGVRYDQHIAPNVLFSSRLVLVSNGTFFLMSQTLAISITEGFSYRPTSRIWNHCLDRSGYRALKPTFPTSVSMKRCTRMFRVRHEKQIARSINTPLLASTMRPSDQVQLRPGEHSNYAHNRY